MTIPASTRQEPWTPQPVLKPTNGQQPQVEYDRNSIPHSPQAESAVIGGTLNRGEFFKKLHAFLKPEMFYLVRHRYVWRAMELVDADGNNIDHVTVGQKLEAVGHLKDVGGWEYLTQTSSAVPWTDNTESYGRLVQALNLRVQLIEFCDQSKQAAMDGAVAVPDVIKNIGVKFDQIASVGLDSQIVTMDQAVNDVLDKVEAMMSGKLRPGFISTGFPKLDQIFSEPGLVGGAERKALTIIGARPGMGKTAAVLTLAGQQADEGQHVEIISNEFGVEDMTMRLLSMASGFPTAKIRTGSLDAVQYGVLAAAAAKVAKRKITLKYIKGTTVQDIEASIWQAGRTPFGPVDIVYVDGIYRMKVANTNVPGQRLTYQDYQMRDRRFQYEYIVNELREMAIAHDIPIWVTHQLNRDCEQRQDKRPILSDLKDAGAIEETADNVIFLYRDVKYNPETEFPNQAEWIVAKNRRGPEGVAFFYFDNHLTKFMQGAVRRVDLSLDALTGDDEGGDHE